ncbi:MAG: twin-arginine translocase TatA/TatE family subunit [Chloroflexi bacterium]|nr:twin-arginine translocase TatA/TatE family subunit [Chloroflexota bacterium]
MANLGAGEMLIILAVLLVLFGANRLPSLARSLGQASKEFREGLSNGGNAEASRNFSPCPSCGSELSDGARFCHHCGQQLSERT